MLIQFMTIEQTLLQEIEESKRWFNLEKDENTYKRELAKRIELINGVLENMKNPNIKICNLIESKMNEIILKINQTYTIFKADKLYTEL
jgi:tRNA U54 and U55 pseudouridine synthase Pus10